MENYFNFCIKNKVSYNLFQKWFKVTHKNVVEVQIDGILVPKNEEDLSNPPQSISNQCRKSCSYLD